LRDVADSAVLQQIRAEDALRRKAVLEDLYGEGVTEYIEWSHNFGGDANYRQTFDGRAMTNLLESAGNDPELSEFFRERFDLTRLDGVDVEIAKKLRYEGFFGVHDIANSSDRKLLAVDGIGPATLEKIRAQVPKADADEEEPEEPETPPETETGDEEEEPSEEESGDGEADGSAT
jgi:hypothetical protein